MKYIKLKSITVVILCIVMMLIPVRCVLAASAAITFSGKNENVEVGEEVIVYLKLSSEEKVGDFQGYVTYNADILEFVSEADFIAGGEGLVKITDTNVAVGDLNRKYTIKFVAKKLGTSEIALKDITDIFEFESGEEMSVSSNHLTIQVGAKEEASKNTSLKSMKISPGTLEPEFSKDIYDYTTKIDHATKQLIISSLPEDGKATVEIIGNEELKVGSNTIKIKVKAEAGNEKIYTITANRGEETKINGENIKEEPSPNDKENVEGEYNTSETTEAIDDLTVYTQNQKIYLQNSIKYEIMEAPEEVSIPEGYEKTTLQLKGVEVTVYTKKNNSDNFLLMYAKNGQGDEGFYQFDQKENTIQRSKAGNTMVMDSEWVKSEEYKSKITTMGIVTAVLGVCCMILSVALIWVFMSRKGRH